jgi:hypothetical protein
MSAVDKGLGLYSSTATPSSPSRSRRTRRSPAVDRSLGSESPLWQSVDLPDWIHARTGGTDIRPSVMHTPADRMHTSAYGMFGEMPRPDSMSTNNTFRPAPPWYSPYYTLPQAPVYTWPAPTSAFGSQVQHVSADGEGAGTNVDTQHVGHAAEAGSQSWTSSGDANIKFPEHPSPAMPPGSIPAVPINSDCLDSFMVPGLANAAPHPRHHSSSAMFPDYHSPSAHFLPSRHTRVRSESNPPLPVHVAGSPPPTEPKAGSWAAM